MKRSTRINALLLLAVAALAVIPLVFGLGDHKEEPFAGADGEAETAITEIEPDYEPWFTPLYEPPSGEIESALFALQAAIGAGVLAYYFGLRKGRRQGEARRRTEPAENGTGEPADSGEPAGGPEPGGPPHRETTPKPEPSSSPEAPRP
ncbi:Cobalt transport protein CbiN [Streptomyces sp. YIM 130001]|uniref:energy-coupling factor ABC transporter substrate-binding protein n=1 Tax=Streptomyces sp. YIM 130001 TaxID=2259644 RepID=UPI000E64F240|nr:energy-coupling factor ABC transporter substrate-binding protein [Streptomyces sp. YIM 130001]RII09209.1 Cobalt transport protein CbiN [Streptomyces sp. YIM 130001]